MEKLSKVRGEIICAFPGSPQQSAIFDTSNVQIAEFSSPRGEPLKIFLYINQGKGGIAFYLGNQADRFGRKEFNFSPDQKGFKLTGERIPLTKNGVGGEVVIVDLNATIIS